MITERHWRASARQDPAGPSKTTTISQTSTNLHDQHDWARPAKQTADPQGLHDRQLPASHGRPGRPAKEHDTHTCSSNAAACTPLTIGMPSRITVPVVHFRRRGVFGVGRRGWCHGVWWILVDLGGVCCCLLVFGAVWRCLLVFGGVRCCVVLDCWVLLGDAGWSWVAVVAGILGAGIPPLATVIREILLKYVLDSCCSIELEPKRESKKRRVEQSSAVGACRTCRTCQNYQNLSNKPKRPQLSNLSNMGPWLSWILPPSASQPYI